MHFHYHDQALRSHRVCPVQCYVCALCSCYSYTLHDTLCRLLRWAIHSPPTSTPGGCDAARTLSLHPNHAHIRKGPPTTYTYHRPSAALGGGAEARRGGKGHEAERERHYYRSILCGLLPPAFCLPPAVCRWILKLAPAPLLPLRACGNQRSLRTVSEHQHASCDMHAEHTANLSGSPGSVYGSAAVPWQCRARLACATHLAPRTHTATVALAPTKRSRRPRKRLLRESQAFSRSIHEKFANVALGLRPNGSAQSSREKVPSLRKQATLSSGMSRGMER